MILISILLRILAIFLMDPFILVPALLSGFFSQSWKQFFLVTVAVGVAVSLILSFVFTDRAINQQVPPGPELFFLRFLAFSIYAGVGFGLRRLFQIVRG